ncbi:cell envelope integrity EipB family protein [Caenispirillum bisanense]|uniref:cell envelope integrity EipB family protein n=1 Tax=Caenispirillum bisanense TaxID=414052 RepID=UPI0031E2ABEE
MIRTTSGIALAGVLVLGVAAAPQDARAESPPRLASHEATYDMQLSSSRSGSGVVGASGTMHYSFTDTCDGYAVNTRTLLSISYGVGSPVMTAWEFSTWESRDGSQYRFKVRNSRNGTLVETIDGRAAMPADGSAGSVTFVQPTEHSLDLPGDTLFPTEHTLLLLAEAQKGTKFINRAVFDGSGDRGPYEVSALIGVQKPAAAPRVGPEKASAGAKDERISTDLLTGPAWPMTMAFFPQEGQDPMPEFQVGLAYHTNGVADSVHQDFGDFSITGTMTDLKPLPKPEC